MSFNFIKKKFEKLTAMQKNDNITLYDIIEAKSDGTG